MKRILLISACILPMMVIAQEITTLKITDWNTLRKSGFYESVSSNVQNAPDVSLWYWGINIAHTSNSIYTAKPYHYGGQIAFSLGSHNAPKVYARSTNEAGEGVWAKLVHSKGDHDIEGGLTLYDLSIGKRMSSADGEISRLKIVPYKHTGGPWLFTSRDTSADAFLDVKYGVASIMTLKHSKKVGILTQNPEYPLDVNGTIRASEVKIEIASGADFVFEPDYKLRPLPEVEIFVKENKHLPEIPSEKQMQEEGVSVNDLQIKLLQKIEELTLYVIEQDKKIEKQNKEIQELKNKLKE